MDDNVHGKINFYHYVFVNKFSNDDFVILLLHMDDNLNVGYDATKIFFFL